ncbi:cobyrinate a,c-diamide synthase [Chitinispirillales bacterium ANBcel5]|uniref:cobyrinate a,c-diamide synthase n=1 Tax=Cellulosispirillum alkaliphilum TaxID=3039283 RepID=UPI002A4F2162|nr:cobyrinate a,c-diamide synthase [Chitinispirillales bacterium ANBcel5]
MKSNKQYAFMIAATGSGVGKTSVSTALCAAFIARGMSVQCFKAGPDFLDPTFSTALTGRPCYNLDIWMCGEEYCRELFEHKSEGADVVVVEGVMGLYDGADSSSDYGSSAHLARLLDIPVLLLIDVRGNARTAAAVVHGMVNFPNAPKVASVIANRVGSPAHGQIIDTALRSVNLSPLAGAVVRGAFPEIASRHLGLMPIDPLSVENRFYDNFAQAAEEHLAIDSILSLTEKRTASADDIITRKQIQEDTTKRVRMAIARDEAFFFYYADDLERLTSEGVELVPFSPLHDEILPHDIDALWIGGGYPEEHAAKLSRNSAMRSSIRQFAENGGVVYAECGGYMYIGNGIFDREEKYYEMCGVLPVKYSMRKKISRLSYAEVTFKTDTFFGPAGTECRGHEFHYSDIVARTEKSNAAYSVSYRKGGSTEEQGCSYKNVIAGYVHLHLSSHPFALKYFVSFVEKNITENL